MHKQKILAVSTFEETVSIVTLILSLVIILSACAGCGKPAKMEKGEYSGRVRVSGSTTLLSLIQEAAVQFNEKNPGARVDVQGGGSSAGLTQLQEKIVDIANSSRELSGSELEADLTDHKIAFDIIAIIVNPENPLKNLTGGQLKGIFTGKIRNWKELGGEDRQIVVVVRDQASGTREMFDEKALGSTKEKPVESFPSAIEGTSNGFVRQVVATTPNAIGYVSYGFIDKSVKAVSLEGTQPTVENAINGKYGMGRWLHMFTRGEVDGAARGFIEFVMSREFQREVVSQEYIEIEKVSK
ncbi:MAG: phosphate ABC transporter substrate-binding protein [Actinobacteria bacterium]|nr:phosphate ABC transporter substrate-binding protein [Actinomycetota bacterium]